MIQFHPFVGEHTVAEITLDAGGKKIKSTDDIMDFFGDCYVNNSVAMMIHKDVFDDSFFDLKTRLAGDILQKMTTYNMKLAIIGDFSNVQSNSLRDFIRESNRKKFINFVPTISEALEVLR